MIDRKELRIGNWLSDGPQEYVKAFRVEELHTNVTIISDFMQVRGERDYEDVYPIRLTMEMLEASGFKLYPAAGAEAAYYSLLLNQDSGVDRIAWYEDVDRWYVSAQHNPRYYGSEVLIEYVHQLQNLYFTLTGKELAVNL